MRWLRLKKLEIGNWRRWKLATLKIGNAGNWRNWKLEKLEIGDVGNWWRWKLEKLEIAEIDFQMAVETRCSPSLQPFENPEILFCLFYLFHLFCLFCLSCLFRPFNLPTCRESLQQLLPRWA